MLNKVIDYKILTGSETDQLEAEVKKMIDAGWTPSGPVFDHADKLNQAMLRFG